MASGAAYASRILVVERKEMTMKVALFISLRLGCAWRKTKIR